MPNSTRKNSPSKSQRPRVKHNSTIRSIGTRLVKASSRTYDALNKGIQNFTNPKRNYEKEANDAAKEYERLKKTMIYLEKGLDNEFNGHQKSYDTIKKKLDEHNINDIQFLFVTYYELMGRTVGQDDNTYVPTSEPEYVYFLYDLFNEKHGPENEPNGDYTYRRKNEDVKKQEREVRQIINTREKEYKKKFESGGGKRKLKKTRKRRSRR
jgi:exonuclease VII large subunit